MALRTYIYYGPTPLQHTPRPPVHVHGRSELEAVFLLPGRPEPLPALLANTEALEELLGAFGRMYSIAI